MAQPLKRTFHGCLTCRRRKVRCLGGSPCLNCSKMSITCHSSFDTNLRVRVATATGQKNLQAKSSTGKSNPLPQAAPIASVPTPTCLDVGDAPTLANHNLHNIAVGTGFWEMPSAPVGHRQTTSFDSGLLSDPWSFSIPPPASPSRPVVPYVQTGFLATESSIYSPLYLDQSAMGIPYFHPSNPGFGSGSETSSFMNAQSQEGISGHGWFQYTVTNYRRS